MNIAFLDLKRQYKGIKKEINVAIRRVINRQYFILGEELKGFEEKFSKYLKIKYTVGVNSGTDGLIIALRALGVGKSDEVITPANSFIATTLAITEVGATPVFIDADISTFQVDVTQIESKITNKTKAILPVHLYGAPCEITKIVSIAKKHKLYVVEDACQSHGATFNKKMTGTFGDISVFSFYPGKNLGAYGDGGAICTNNRQIYEKLLKLRNYGQSKKYYHDEIGLNSRLDEIQAAILQVKLKHLNSWNNHRNKIAKKYNANISNINSQKIIKGGKSNYHLFVIRTKNRDKVIKFLSDNGINTLIHYPVPIHLQKCYKYLNYTVGNFPVTEKLASEIISLPIYSELSEKEINYVINKVNQSLTE